MCSAFPSLKKGFWCVFGSATVFVDDQEVAVNLIITDYCMPGMTGYDLLKKIKVATVFSVCVSWYGPSMINWRQKHLKMYMLVLLKQESTSLRDIPVVIMSSENIPSRINRWEFLLIFVLLFQIISWFLKEQIQVKRAEILVSVWVEAGKQLHGFKITSWSCSENYFMVWKLWES